jgi:hypothetical protein
MWITAFFQRKHSLSTCGQTVCKYVEVIHIINRLVRPLKVHVIPSLVFATGHRFEEV